MLKADYQRWNKLVETDHHDLNEEEIHQFVNELKDAVGEVIQECKKAYDYYNRLDYENTLLKVTSDKVHKGALFEPQDADDPHRLLCPDCEATLLTCDSLEKGLCPDCHTFYNYSEVMIKSGGIGV